MAHSPSPSPSTFVGSLTIPRLQSATPPLAVPISKRDKRRFGIDNKFKTIVEEFSTSRETHLRAQLNSISKDIYYINQANPYLNKPLDDLAEDLAIDFNTLGEFGLNSLRGASTAAESESRIPLGRYAAQFVERVNNFLEERDAGLTEVDLRYKSNVEYLRMEYDFSLDTAKAEHRTMREHVRERAINAIKQKKRQLQKEKDQLDAADGNTLIFNSGQFAITQPASPGGAQNHRKTRHTRHCLDLDNLEGVGESHKRKRKVDIEHDSPGPNGKGVLDGPSNWEKINSLFAQDHVATPALTIDRLLTPKELVNHLKEATELTARQWTAKRSKHPHNGKGPVPILTNGDISDLETLPQLKPASEEEEEDTSALVAPVMDRTGSHTTRSTRNNPVENPYAYDPADRDADDRHRLFGIAAMRAVGSRAKNQLEAPTVKGLSTEAQEDDLAAFSELISADKY